MPFKSEAQRRFLWAKHPRIARRWAHEHPGQHDLPRHVDDEGEKKSSLGPLAALRALGLIKTAEPFPGPGNVAAVPNLPTQASGNAASGMTPNPPAPPGSNTPLPGQAPAAPSPPPGGFKPVPPQIEQALSPYQQGIDQAMASPGTKTARDYLARLLHAPGAGTATTATSGLAKLAALVGSAHRDCQDRRHQHATASLVKMAQPMNPFAQRALMMQRMGMNEQAQMDRVQGIPGYGVPGGMSQMNQSPMGGYGMGMMGQGLGLGQGMGMPGWGAMPGRAPTTGQAYMAGRAPQSGYGMAGQGGPGQAPQGGQAAAQGGGADPAALAAISNQRQYLQMVYASRPTRNAYTDAHYRSRMAELDRREAMLQGKTPEDPQALGVAKSLPASSRGGGGGVAPASDKPDVPAATAQTGQASGTPASTTGTPLSGGDFETPADLPAWPQSRASGMTGQVSGTPAQGAAASGGGGFRTPALTSTQAPVPPAKATAATSNADNYLAPPPAGVPAATESAAGQPGSAAGPPPAPGSDQFRGPPAPPPAPGSAEFRGPPASAAPVQPGQPGSAVHAVAQSRALEAAQARATNWGMAMSQPKEAPETPAQAQANAQAWAKIRAGAPKFPSQGAAAPVATSTTATTPPLNPTTPPSPVAEAKEPPPVPGASQPVVQPEAPKPAVQPAAPRAPGPGFNPPRFRFHSAGQGGAGAAPVGGKPTPGGDKTGSVPRYYVKKALGPAPAPAPLSPRAPGGALGRGQAQGRSTQTPAEEQAAQAPKPPAPALAPRPQAPAPPPQGQAPAGSPGFNLFDPNSWGQFGNTWQQHMKQLGSQILGGQSPPPARGMPPAQYHVEDEAQAEWEARERARAQAPAQPQPPSRASILAPAPTPAPTPAPGPARGQGLDPRTPTEEQAAQALNLPSPYDPVAPPPASSGYQGAPGQPMTGYNRPLASGYGGDMGPTAAGGYQGAQGQPLASGYGGDVGPTGAGAKAQFPGSDVAPTQATAQAPAPAAAPTTQAEAVGPPAPEPMGPAVPSAQPQPTAQPTAQPQPQAQPESLTHSALKSAPPEDTEEAATSKSRPPPATPARTLIRGVTVGGEPVYREGTITRGQPRTGVEYTYGRERTGPMKTQVAGPDTGAIGKTRGVFGRS